MDTKNPNKAPTFVSKGQIEFDRELKKPGRMRKADARVSIHIRDYVKEKEIELMNKRAHLEATKSA